jgi:hypothetical protein
MPRRANLTFIVIHSGIEPNEVSIYRFSACKTPPKSSKGELVPGVDSWRLLILLQWFDYSGPGPKRRRGKTPRGVIGPRGHLSTSAELLYEPREHRRSFGRTSLDIARLMLRNHHAGSVNFLARTCKCFLSSRFLIRCSSPQI